MRLFIATSLPAEILRDLNERVTRVRPRLPAASWVREESQHVTFAFLGEQRDALIDELDADLRAALATMEHFESGLEGAGFFPNARRARVGWVGLRPEMKFAGIASAVRRIVTNHGVELDGGEFRPHLTLMRMRDPWPPSSIDLFGKTLQSYRSAPFVVDTVTLYSSDLHPKGAIHTVLRTFPLA
jgi:2'-5' RNA ligase